MLVVYVHERKNQKQTLSSITNNDLISEGSFNRKREFAQRERVESPSEFLVFPAAVSNFLEISAWFSKAGLQEKILLTKKAQQIT